MTMIGAGMCGRFGFAKSKENVKKRFNLKKLPDELPLKYNIAPQQQIPVILNESPDELSMIRWGLLPSWSKEEKTAYSMTNARAETIMEKPSYKKLIQSKRCLILADSFYEWQKNDAGKVPHRIYMKNEDMFAFAGIWDCWEKEGKGIKTCSIITTSPNSLMKSIHDRMPVILKESDEAAWLSNIKIDRVLALLTAYSDDQMAAYPISTLVNSPTNNSPKTQCFS